MIFEETTLSSRVATELTSHLNIQVSRDLVKISSLIQLLGLSVSPARTLD